MEKKIVRVRVTDQEPTERKEYYIDKTFLYYGPGISVEYERSLDALIEDLIEKSARYSKRFTNICIESERDCGCRHECHCSPSLILYGERMETDLEFKYRVAAVEKREAEDAARKKAQYEALKKEFGDS